jgi:hypothetical protein
MGEEFQNGRKLKRISVEEAEELSTFTKRY